MKALLRILSTLDCKTPIVNIRSIALSAIKYANLLAGFYRSEILSTEKEIHEDEDSQRKMDQKETSICESVENGEKKDENLFQIEVFKTLVLSLKAVIRLVTHYGVVISSFNISCLAEKSRGISIIFRKHQSVFDQSFYRPDDVLPKSYLKYFERWLAQFKLLDER